MHVAAICSKFAAMVPRFLVVAAALAFLTACPSGGQTPAPTNLQNVDPDAPASLRVVVLFENLASSLDASRQDCDQVAAQLYGWIQSNEKGYGGLSASAESSPLEGQVHSDYSGRLERALTTVVEVAGGCQDHPGAQAAFTEFDVLLDPQQ